MPLNFSFYKHEILENIANAIREIGGGTSSIAPQDFPARIRALKPSCINQVIDTLPYFEDFEGYTTSTTPATGVEPTCWELVHEDVAMTAANRPQLYCYSAFTHSGNYSLLLKNRGVYAMPALSSDIDLNTLHLEMYLRQANAKYRLEVGVWEDNGTFTPVALVNNSSTNVEFVEIDFSDYSGTGHRIAFRNVLPDGVNLDNSTNYLDDITISINPNA